MKTRTITGIFLFIFVAPFVIFGTYSMAVFVLLLLILSLYEFLNIKKKGSLDPIPNYIYIVAFVFSFLMIFDIPHISNYAYNYSTGLLETYGINSLWLILFIMSLFTSSIFDKRLSVIDAVYVFATITYLSLGLKGLLFLRSKGGIENLNDGMFLVIYLLIVTCSTDIFAYFGGMICKKILKGNIHKLNERISPKKTIEGTIIGTIFGSTLGFIFAFFVLTNTSLVYPWHEYLLLSFFLSICGQIGDLILSAIKRYFVVKDYSSLLPGHGGVLDRIDSLLTNCMVAAIFLTLIAYI